MDASGSSSRVEAGKKSASKQERTESGQFAGKKEELQQGQQQQEPQRQQVRAWVG